jgi:hypothetical protein
MPTIACRAFGVPGCLDQLNYKKPDNPLLRKIAGVGGALLHTRSAPENEAEFGLDA